MLISFSCMQLNLRAYDLQIIQGDKIYLCRCDVHLAAIYRTLNGLTNCICMHVATIYTDKNAIILLPLMDFFL